MPDLQSVSAGRDAFDSKAAVRSANGVKGMVIDANKGLHPAMNITLDDDITGPAQGLNYFRTLRRQGKVQIAKPIQVDGVEDWVAVDSFDGTSSGQDGHMRSEAAFSVVQDKPEGFRSVVFR